ncbi:MAG: protein-L-isoaspartate(D-aspartate) O-methyltransferase [Deltaproteobacteria bacterium]|nr:MAG: protein-L-isoaspartate(D-aspartate) O-methyltransferase [Deltaproteobacteria bacterium]
MPWDAKRLARHLAAQPELTDRRVLEAIARVPRDLFVPEAYRDLAYADTAVPLAPGSTVSQPFIVAYMTQAARVAPGDRVLEVGTGSGYQAAVLAELGAEVYTIERSSALAEAAKARLEALGYDRVHVRAGDGAEGWPEAAPFDAILVTAHSPEIPPALVAQLAPGGRLVIPLGPPEAQRLESFVKNEEGTLHPETRIPVRFVPLVPGASEEAAP